MSDHIDTDSYTFTLTPAELEATRDKLEKVNARAIKRGFTGRFELNAVREVRSEKLPSDLVAEHVVYTCQITGERALL